MSVEIVILFLVILVLVSYSSLGLAVSMGVTDSRLIMETPVWENHTALRQVLHSPSDEAGRVLII